MTALWIAGFIIVVVPAIMGSVFCVCCVEALIESVSKSSAEE